MYMYICLKQLDILSVFIDNIYIYTYTHVFIDHKHGRIENKR